MIWLILSIKFSLDIVEHMITISNEFKHVNMFGKNSFYVKMEYVQNVEKPVADSLEADYVVHAASSSATSEPYWQ